MTLILASVSWAGVLQVTDRLVTQSIGGRNRPFDPASNKNLVFLTRNGVATIAYTGLSFLDAGKRIHTDQWIAETIIGRSLSDGPEGQPAMLQGGGRRGWPDLGQAIDRIQRRLPEALAALPTSWRRQPPTVTVAGWMHYRRRRKWSRPFGCEIHHIQGLGYTRRWLDRQMWGGCFIGMCPSGHLTGAEWNQLVADVRGRDLARTEQVFLEQIGRTAGRPHSAVGADCMSITVEPPQRERQIVRVRYRPATQQAATFRTDRGTATMPVFFSPWILAPATVAAPRIIGGGGTGVHQLGYFEVHVEGPPLPARYKPGGLIHIEEAQRRRQAP